MGIINEAPYYDKFDKSKGYSQILAVPGRVAQAREITELQTTLKSIIRSVGDSVMNDGDIIEGCQISVDLTNYLVYISEGRIYLNGMVFDVEAPINTEEYKSPNVLSINGTGEELICIGIKESIVTSSIDADLLDPALGNENYRQPGCDRLKTVLDFRVLRPTDTETLKSFTLLGRLIDGVLVQINNTPYSDITNILARRTYDESGSYLVNGLDTRVEDVDDQHFNVVVEPGKAYVHGYEVTIPSANRIELEKSLTTITIDTGNTNVYTTGSSTFLCQGDYVKKSASTTRVTGFVAGSTQGTLSGNPKSIELDAAIVSDVSISTYTQGEDYNVAMGSGDVKARVVWIDSGTAPTGSLTITYNKQVVFIYDTDYKIGVDEYNASRLYWVAGGSHPVDNSLFSVVFDKYLARKDTVYLDQYGKISVISGGPADYGTEVAPEAPTYTLHLATVTSPPGGSSSASSDASRSIKVSNVGLTRFTMKDIHSIVNRVKTMMYDQAVLSLNTEAKDAGIDGKKGIFTDSLLDLSKIDTSFNLDASGDRVNEYAPIHDVTLDLTTNMIYLPLKSSIGDMVYNPTTSTTNKAVNLLSLNRTASGSDDGRVSVLSQMKANKSFLITPYVSLPQTPEITIDPSKDSWYDLTVIEVPKSVTDSRVVYTGSRLVEYGKEDSGNSSYTASINVVNSKVGTEVNTIISEDVISEEIATYVREREITVTGRNYPSNIDNIACYFDNTKLALTPSGTTQAGTVSGTVKADSQGSFVATFTVPGGTFYTGTRLVTLESPIQREGYTSTASAYYQSDGVSRTIRKTVTTVTTILMSRIEEYVKDWYNPDPLAQTFTLDSNTILTGIDIYFESKPTIPLGGTAAPVVCEVRTVSNGMVAGEVLGSKRLDSVDVSVSDDSSVATRFIFDNPVILEGGIEYAIVLKSSSMDYTVYGAEINGEPDLLTGEPIVSNVYIQGVLQTSSNNTSWTVHQKSDLKFNLLTDRFTTQSVAEFSSVQSEEGFCRITLAAEYIEFDNTNISWEYSTDLGATYKPIYPYETVLLSDLKYDIRLKATLNKSASSSMSPLLDANSVTLKLDCYENDTTDISESGIVGDYLTHNAYVSNYISGLDDYDTLTVYLDVYEPTGTTVDVWMSPDSSISSETPYELVKLTEDNNPTALVGDWKEFKYTVDNLDDLNNCRIFIELHNVQNSLYVSKSPAVRRLRAIMSNSVVS